MATNEDRLVDIFNRIANRLTKIGMNIKIKDDDIDFALNGLIIPRWYVPYDKNSLEDKLRHFLLNENCKMFGFIMSLADMLACIEGTTDEQLRNILNNHSNSLEELEIQLDIYGI
jgi:hypothetical protein